MDNYGTSNNHNKRWACIAPEETATGRLASITAEMYITGASAVIKLGDSTIEFLDKVIINVHCIS